MAWNASQTAATTLTEWQEWGPVWTLNSVDRSHMYCVVVLHISYDDRLRSDRYEVTTQRHVGIAAQRWCEHRMESRRRRQAVSGTASPLLLLLQPLLYQLLLEEHSYKYRLLAPCLLDVV